jgi:REP element-mobilizing transposase RayT
MLDLIETGVVFSPQLQEAENLNKESFTKEELSDDSYYVKSALMTKQVKKEIEN